MCRFEQFTEAYNDFCMTHGKFVHHNARGALDSTAVREERYKRTYKLYSKCFPPQPVDSVWPSPPSADDDALASPAKRQAIEVEVYRDGASMFAIRVNSETSAHGVRTLIAAGMGLKSEELNVRIRDRFLFDDEKTALNLSERHIITVHVRKMPLVEMYVKTLTGKTVTVKLDPGTDVVLNMKRAIQNCEGIPPDQQRICYLGEQLHDTRQLSWYGLKKKSTVNLIMRLRGC
jgi:ubiquitin